jgi:hypothetical protein
MDEIVIVTESISVDDLKTLAQKSYGHLIKGVVDIEREVVAFGGEWHIQANMKLSEKGSSQADCWGFNVVFDLPKDSWIEYKSLINIRPLSGNRNIEVQDDKIRERMKKIINKKII